MKKELVALMCVALLSGCTSTDSTQTSDQNVQTPERDVSALAEVNYEAGTVTLPLERYFMNRVESGTEYNANILKVALCTSEKGFPAYWRSYGEPALQEWERYGRWNLKNAEQYGYMPVPSPEFEKGMEENNVWGQKNQSVLSSAEYTEARDECAEADPQSPINALTLEDGAPQEVLDMRNRSYELMLGTSEAKQVFDEWEQCLTENGVKLNPEVSPFAVEGVSYDSVDEASIKAAIKDVTCKQKTDFMQRLANIEASFQQPVAKKYEAELVSMRSDIDERMANVYEYLKQNSSAGEELK